MDATNARLVDYRAHSGVAVITLDNPPMNCFTFEMMHELDEAILRARFDDEVHVIVLCGAGDRTFCAGADARLLQAVTPAFKYNFSLHANETLSRLEQTPKLVIAALNGHAVGGGFEIALAADLRVARKGAGKLGLPQVAVGTLPGTGGTQRLPRLIGQGRAIEMMVTGGLVGFEEAHRLGIVNEVWEVASPEEFMEKVLAYAGGFCPPHKAAKAVGRIKRAVRTGSGATLETGLALERELQQQLYESEDAKEGLGAYVAKRKPRFTGR